MLKLFLQSRVKNFKIIIYFRNIVKQIFYTNDKTFVFFNTAEIKIFLNDVNENFCYYMNLILKQKNIKKIIFSEENSIFFALSEDGIIYKFYYPNQKNLDLNCDKNISLFKKLKDENPHILNYTCYLLRVNFDEVYYKDIFLMKNYLILLDKTSNFYSINIDNLNLYLDKDPENLNSLELNKNNIGNSDSLSYSFKENQNQQENNSEIDENNSNKNENLIVIDTNTNEKKFSDNNYFNVKPKSNFEDILVKLFQINSNIIKIDCSESLLIFSDEQNKVFFNLK